MNAGAVASRATLVATTARTGWLERAAFGGVVLVACTFAFERVEPSLGLTRDLRLTNLRVEVLLGLVLWLAARLSERRIRRPGTAGVACGAWLAVVLVSALAAPTYQTQALAFVRDLVMGALFGWCTFDLVRGPGRRQAVCRAMAVGAAGVGVAGVLEALRLDPVLRFLDGFKYESFSLGEFSRVSSTLPHPNITASVLALSLPLTVVWLATSRSYLGRLVLAAALVAGVVALLLTLSRGGVVVGILELAALAGVGIWKRHPMLVRVCLATAAGIAMVGVAAVLARPVLLVRAVTEATNDWYGASYIVPEDITLRPNETTQVGIEIANTGSRAWQPTDRYSFGMSYHLRTESGSTVVYDGPRTPLERDVISGESLRMRALVVAPSAPGVYVLEWDALQDPVTWFSWRGAPVARSRLVVQGEPVQATAAVESPGPHEEVAPVPGRLEQWRMALRMARHRPLLGVGPDNFRWVYGDYAGLPRWDTGGHANSLYFEWLADTGLLGLLTLAWFAWSLGRAVFGSLRARLQASGGVPTASLWEVAVALSLLGWFAHGTVDYFLEPLPTAIAFWMLAGLALSGASHTVPSERTR